MQFWDLRRLQQYYEKHDPHPVYLFFGDEPYLIDECLSLVKSHVLQEGLSDFNYDSFHAKETKVYQILDCVETLPMMGAKRLVVIKGIESLKEKDWKVLLPYVENPVESCILVLMTYGKVDKRKKFVKSISNKGIAVELKRPYENQMGPWVQYIATQFELQFDRDSLFLFLRAVGNDLYSVKNEVLKLKQYLGEGVTAVSSDDVMQVVSQSRAESIFELTDSIGSQQVDRSLGLLRKLLDQGQNEIGIVSLVLRHMRVLATIREGYENGLRGQALTTKAGVPPFFFKKYFAQSQNWTASALKNQIYLLAQTDKALKSSPLSSMIWLENFIIQSCALKKEGTRPTSAPLLF